MMPRSGGEPVSSGSSVLPDSLYYNPFAGHSDSFTSAVKLSESRAAARPAYRRRGSESAARKDREYRATLDGEEEYLGTNPDSHMRSRTEDYATITGASSHPLASSSRNSQNTSDDANTHMNRSGSNLEPFHSGSTASHVFHNGLSSSVAERGATEKIVIVHQVASKDSLEGVALKYGISLTDLRRANQMWTSDSIHLRKVLYIPLEKSHRAKEIMIMLSEVEMDETSPALGPNGSEVVERRLPEHNLTIRRIPASHLSFFPTTSDADSDNAASFHSLPRSYKPRKPNSGNELSRSLSTSLPPATGMYTTHPFSMSPEGSSTGTQIRTHLASLFNALPIAPSTRETLISRLSLESGASTPSQYSEEQDHELEDVREMRRPSPNTRIQYLSGTDPHYLNSLSLPDHPVGGQNLELRLVHSSPVSPRKLTRSATLPPTRTFHTLDHCGRSGYLSPDTRQPSTEAVRTAQLEPSPTMQLPSRGKGKNDES